MKAYKHLKYGSLDFLELGEVDKPEPKEDEVLIRIFATTVNRTDCAALQAYPFVWRFTKGLINPKNSILGSEFAGIITEIGKNIEKFAINDVVFGFKDSGKGSHAEFLTINEKFISKKPSETTIEEAAASTEGFHYAYNFINKVKAKPQNNILINGATGGIGSALLQICKTLNCKITATSNTKNLDLIKELGADNVIDYTKENFTQSEEKFDFVFDTVGKSTFGKCKKILNPKGIYISSELGPGGQNIFYSLFTPLLSKLGFNKGKKVLFPMPINLSKSIEIVSEMLANKTFKPIIDKTYTFDQIKDAFKYVDKGLKTGNVVIKIFDNQ